MFDRFIVDKTHGVLVFNHSFDELAFCQSLCRGEEREAQVSPRTLDARWTVCKEAENYCNDSYLRDHVLTAAWLRACVYVLVR